MSPHELKREAIIIARRLARQKAWLENFAGASDSKAKWIFVSAKTSRKSKTAPLCTELVSAMQASCWLKSDPSGCWRLSAAGAEKLLNASDGERFAAQHQNRQPRIIKDQDGRTISVMSNEAESPLGWMRARKDKTGKPLLSLVQFEAGERLRQDFTLAQMSPRVTASWEFSTPPGGKRVGRSEGAMEISERAMTAKKRFFAALDCLGPEMSGVVYEVCCLASGLEAAERQFNWPRRSAKLVLQIALGKLSEHYGFVQPPNELQRTGAIRKWGRENYRPLIPPATP